MPIIRAVLAFLLLSPLAAPGQSSPQGSAAKGGDAKDPFGGLKLRAIGPAIASGRIAAFAVHPTDASTYYVAVASGGVWKTINSGTTWTPIFDSEGSYSI